MCKYCKIFHHGEVQSQKKKNKNNALPYRVAGEYLGRLKSQYLNTFFAFSIFSISIADKLFTEWWHREPGERQVGLREFSNE